MKTESKFNWKRYSALLALVLLFIVLGIVTKGDFLTARNFTNLTRQISVNGILAVGMTMVILTAGIDLSVGSIVALCGVIMGLLQVNMDFAAMGFLGALLAFAAAMMTGAITGTLTGLPIAYLGIPPFVITLGMMVMAGGGALILSNAQAISPMSEEFKWPAKGLIPPIVTIIIAVPLILFWIKSAWKRLQQFSMAMGVLFGIVLEGLCLTMPLFWFSSDRGLPIPTLILMICAGVCHWGLSRLAFGRKIYAVGGNEEAAHLSGIDVPKVKVIVYMMMGILAALASVVLTGRLNSASPTVGTLMELDAIAAVVIGGTSLMGGAGSVLGSIIGAFLIGTLNNGMDLLGVNSNYQMVFKGIIIIVAVWSDSRSKRKGAR
jgi:D-xylose transport system permease protein